MSRGEAMAESSASYLSSSTSFTSLHSDTLRLCLGLLCEEELKHFKEMYMN